MGLLTRIMAGNKLHAKGLSSKHSNVRMLVSGGGRATETSKRGRGSLGVREWEACAALRGQEKRRNTRALGDWRAGTKEEQPGPCGSLGHPRVARESWGLRSSHRRAEETSPRVESGALGRPLGHGGRMELL